MDEEQLPKQLKQLPNSTEWLKNGRWTEFSQKQELVPICSPMEVFIYLPNNFPEEFNNRSEKIGFKQVVAGVTFFWSPLY